MAYINLLAYALRVSSPAFFFLAMHHINNGDFKQGLITLICGLVSYYFVSCYTSLGSCMSILSYILNPPKKYASAFDHPEAMELIGKPVKILYGEDHVIIKMEDIPRVGDIITFRTSNGSIQIKAVEKVTRDYLNNEIMIIVL